MSSEFPRSYTPAELEAIAQSVFPFDLAFSHIERLQRAVEEYQWATQEHNREFLALHPSGTNRGRRKLLKRIIELCDVQASSEEIEAELKKLDARTSQSLDVADRQQLRRPAESALRKIPTRGPDPRRARRQYVGDLACIYVSVTGRRPGRRFHKKEYGEYGPFLEFVKAALNPFKAAQGCEADIKAVLKRLKDAELDKNSNNYKPSCSHRLT
jgi:hypothetical protein